MAFDRPQSSRSRGSPPSYLDATLSLFERPKKVKVHRPRAPKVPRSYQSNSSSTENLLEKKAPSITTSVTSVLAPNDADTEGIPWVSGIYKRIPWSGALALLTVLLCAGADAAILYKSDGQPVDSWQVSPSVLLAILSAVANVCLQYARSQGMVIAVSLSLAHSSFFQSSSTYL